MPAYLYQLQINNGIIYLGNAVKYFGFTCLDQKNKSAIASSGRVNPMMKIPINTSYLTV